MTPKLDGGYDHGYRGTPCLWGTAPGSIVRQLLAMHPASSFPRVLDLGCGEGKNSVPFAQAGCRAEAVDCSSNALNNGRKAFPGHSICWIEADALRFEIAVGAYDLIVAYGLFHCLRSRSDITALARRIRAGTRPGGYNAVCAFNDRSQDLRAHPGFQPTLMPHDWYLSLYHEWDIVEASDADIHEAHPHNGIQHHHSLTHLLARRSSAA